MATLRVNTTVMSDQVAELQALLQRLEDISSDVAAVNQQLQWRTSLSTSIRNNLSQHSEYVGQLREIASALSGALSSAVEQYTSTENKLVGVAQSTASNIVTVAAGDGSDTDSDAASWLEELTSKLKTLFSGIGTVTDDSEAGFIGGIFGTIASYLALLNTEVSDWSLSDILAVFKDETGALSKLMKLLDESGLSDMTGLTSSLVGLFSNFSDMAGADIDAFISSLDDAVSSGGDVASALYGILTGAESAVIDIFSICSSVGVRFSTSLALYAADGFEFTDILNALVDSSALGVTLVTGKLCPFVDIDADEFIDSLRSNADVISQYIAQGDMSGIDAAGTALLGSIGALLQTVSDVSEDSIPSAFKDNAAAFGNWLGQLGLSDFTLAVGSVVSAPGVIAYTVGESVVETATDVVTTIADKAVSAGEYVYDTVSDWLDSWF